MELTSGFVAGIIAAGLMIVKLSAPTAMTFILAVVLRDKETAATWTAASSPLQSSFWPTLLRADASRSQEVRRAVRCITIAIPSFAVLVSIASVITPLGLYEQELPDSAKSIPFQYVRDPSTIFAGTSARNGEPFTRECWLDADGTCRGPCPYDEINGNVFFNGTHPDPNATSCPDQRMNATVSNTLRDIYTSGTSRSTTVSNFFDIEWRQLTYKRENVSNSGEAIPAGTFRFLESFILTDSFNLVEGLVVDAKNGGIGFRNHTVPASPNLTSVWSEDLLFIEPTTVCVNQNISIDFNISYTGNSSAATMSAVKLVDHGGFANFNTSKPFDDRNDRNETLNRPDLHSRAYMAAWYSNILLMAVLNITNVLDHTAGTPVNPYIRSRIGRQFDLPLPSGKEASKYQTLGIMQNLGDILGFEFRINRTNDKFKNPWKIDSENFSTPIRLCQDIYAYSPTKLNYTYVSCTAIRGSPRRVDPGNPVMFQDRSSWSSSVYTCASAIRATVKTVDFSHNGSVESIKSLKILDIKEKAYRSEAEMPLWGVEDAYLSLSEIVPIWGILDPAYQGIKNVSTIQQPWLYLPGASLGLWQNGLEPGKSRDNIAAGIAPLAAMNSILGKDLASITGENFFDYFGKSSMSLWLKWRDLSSSADSVPMILKLLWTDVAASAMVGTKGILGRYNTQPDRAADIKVRQVIRRVMYRYPFGIPAFLSALCLLLVLAALLLCLATRRLNFAVMKRRLNQTSLGRALTTVMYRDSSDFTMSSDSWNRSNGARNLDFNLVAGIVLVEEETNDGSKINSAAVPLQLKSSSE